MPPFVLLVGPVADVGEEVPPFVLLVGPATDVGDEVPAVTAAAAVGEEVLSLVLFVVLMDGDCDGEDDSKLPLSISSSSGVLSSATEVPLFEGAFEDATMEAVKDGVLEAVKLGTLDAVIEGTTEAVTDGVLEAVTLGVTDAVIEGTLEAVTDGVLDFLTLGTLDAAIEGTIEAVTDGVLEAVTVGVTDAVIGAEGAGTGAFSISAHWQYELPSPGHVSSTPLTQLPGEQHPLLSFEQSPQRARHSCLSSIQRAPPPQIPQFSSDSLQKVSSPFKQVTKSFVQQCSLSSDGLFDAVIEGAADVTDGTLEAVILGVTEAVIEGTIEAITDGVLE